MRELLEKKTREERKKKRKIRQAKIKATRLMLMGGLKPDDAWDNSEEQRGLFKLADLQTTEDFDLILGEEAYTDLKNKKIKMREPRKTVAC